MKKIFITIGILLLGAISFQVFANFYNTQVIDRIDFDTFGGRIVKEAIFSYDWVENFGAETKTMEKVLKKIEDINDGRLLYNNMVYVGEKYTGQRTQNIFVKDFDSQEYFIDEQRTGMGATLAERCELNGFNCELLSSANFETGKEYYIKMRNEVPFYINFCSKATESFIAGKGCVETHTHCANDTGLQRFLEDDGITLIPASEQFCSCGYGSHYNPNKNSCVIDGEDCAEQGGEYDDSTGVCTLTIERATGGSYSCQNNIVMNTAGNQKLHKAFWYPPNIINSELTVEGDYVLGFISTGNRTGGHMYEWNGSGCTIQDSSDKSFGRFSCDGNDGTYENESHSPETYDTVYLSLRAACGEGDTIDYGLEERKTTLTIEYVEAEE